MSNSALAAPAREIQAAELAPSEALVASQDEGWFGLLNEEVLQPPIPVEAEELLEFSYATAFEPGDGYSAEETVMVEFDDETITSAPGALFAFGDWVVIVDGDVEDNQEIMKVINHGVVDATIPSDQVITVNGTAIGSQYAGYGDDWEAYGILADFVSLSVDLRVEEAGEGASGLWGIGLFSASDSEGFIEAFGGLGFFGGEIFLTLDGLTTEGSALGSVPFGEWITLALEFDFETGVFDAYVNGDQMAFDIAFDNYSNLIGLGAFGQGSSLGTQEVAFFDNYSILMVGSQVPEPNSLMLLGLFAFSLLILRRRPKCRDF